MTDNRLRSCAGCSAHILTNDGRSQVVFCNKCRGKYRPDHAGWSAALKSGDVVFVQPIRAWRGLSFSRNLVIDRDGDDVTVQIIGIPESRQTVNIGQLAPYDMTPR